METIERIKLFCQHCRESPEFCTDGFCPLVGVNPWRNEQIKLAIKQRNSDNPPKLPAPIDKESDFYKNKRKRFAEQLIQTRFPERTRKRMLHFTSFDINKCTPRQAMKFQCWICNNGQRTPAKLTEFPCTSETCPFSINYNPDTPLPDFAKKIHPEMVSVYAPLKEELDAKAKALKKAKNLAKKKKEKEEKEKKLQQILLDFAKKNPEKFMEAKKKGAF